MCIRDRAGGFSRLPVYKVFFATPEYLLVFWRTLGLCAGIVAGQVLLSVLAGLGFARYDFPGKGLWFFLLLVAVSYTHLDVYKRQGPPPPGLGCPSWPGRWPKSSGPWRSSCSP